MQQITTRNSNTSVTENHFRITSFEDLYQNENMEEGLHRHDFFFLMILEKADGKHHIDFINIPVASNTVTFLRPGQVHELILKKGSKGYLITFNAAFYHKEIVQIVARQHFYRLNQSSFQKILNVSKHIFEEFTKKEKAYKTVLKANLDILFVLLSRHINEKRETQNGKNSEEQLLLDQLIRKIEHQFDKKKQVSDYAKDLHITTYKINKITKQLLGKSCSQLINEQIILESKRFLLATSLQVNEIAFKLGYEDPAYFIRFFKKHTNFTPKSFRQNFKKVPFF